MKRLISPVLVLAAIAIAGCGSDSIVTASTSTPDPVATTAPVAPPTATAQATTPTPTLTPAPEDPMAEPTGGPTAPPPSSSPTPTALPAQPSVTATPTPESHDSEQRSLLDAARARWQANRPASYELVYLTQCECDQGPWKITSSASGETIVEHVFLPGLGDAPFLSVDAIFDDIGAALDGTQPVEVDYDPVNGVPLRYTFNEPALAVDGGFILIVDDFVSNPEQRQQADREALLAARDLWAAAGPVDDYDYTLVNSCFCPPEYVGPYDVSVRGGVVVDATYDGIDLLDIEVLGANAYSDRVLRVTDVFDEIDRAITEADSYSVDYHPSLGYPTSVFIDWQQIMADEESGYQITDLRPAGP